MRSWGGTGALLGTSGKAGAGEAGGRRRARPTPTAMMAIISDIHGNYEALQAVLEDIDSLNIKQIVCLGDVVGYGPDPVECMEIIQKICRLVILGNHEEAVLKGCPPNFNPKAKRAIDWTRKVLFEDGVPREISEQRRKWMDSCTIQTRIQGVTYVHGSPRQPTREYVTPRDALNKQKMKDIFDHMEDYCFCGHTHTPGVFSPDGFTHPSDLFDLYMLGTDEKCLVNVGSVGQPRDGDPRGCYVTFDGDTILWRR
ncbi:MAG: metallophosphoesterase, partial [Planctomycetota bacterium]|nr:metallophosphoesterase [Planctomycetota bacterium]